MDFYDASLHRGDRGVPEDDGNRRRGWRAQLQGKKLVMNLGFSHPVEFTPPQGIEIVVENPIKLVVKGIDKELVGQTCALIREYCPLEPYHGKGIRF